LLTDNARRWRRLQSRAGSQPPQTMSQQYSLSHGQVQSQLSASRPWASAPLGGGFYSTASPVHSNPHNHVQNHWQHSLGYLSHRGPHSPLDFPNDPLAGTAYGEAEARAYQPFVQAPHHPSLPSELTSQGHGLQAPATPVSPQGAPAHTAAHSSGPLHIDTYRPYRRSSGNNFSMRTSASRQGTYPSFVSQTSPTQQLLTGLVPPRGVGAGGPGGYGQSTSTSLPTTPFRHYGYYQHCQQPKSPLGALIGHSLNTVSQHGDEMGIFPDTAQNPHGPIHMYHGALVPLDRPFKCHQCTQCFSRNHDLKRHKRIHLEVKPFSCDFCTKQFSRKDALKVRL
jgi:uncharacterized Zn-finger protein